MDSAAELLLRASSWALTVSAAEAPGRPEMPLASLPAKSLSNQERQPSR